MISCAMFARMYGPSRGIESFQEIHTLVTDRIPIVYTEILDFSFSVKKYMSKPKACKCSADRWLLTCPYVNENKCGSLEGWLLFIRPPTNMAR